MTRFMLRHVQRHTRRSGEHTAPTDAMHVWRFVQIDVVAHVSKRRWLLPLLMSIVLSLVFSSDLRNQLGLGPEPTNTWDLLFRMFASPYGIFYCFTPLYLYLISDLLSESGFNEAMLLRIQSRSAWWTGKIITLSLLVCAYVITLVAAAIVVGSFMLPWEYQWSLYTQHDPLHLTLPSEALVYTPVSVLVWQLLLLGLAWFSLGLVVLVGERVFSNEKWGFGLGMLLNLSGVIALHVAPPVPLDRLVLNYHMIVGTHAFGNAQSSYPSFIVSCWYWITWSAALILAGWWLTIRHDFLRKA